MKATSMSRGDACRGSAIVLAAAAVLLHARGASAAPRDLSVQLDPAITTCPDAAGIRQRLLSVVPDAGESTDVAVAFVRRARGYEATIRLSGATVGTRVIKHDKTSCDAMINAVGVALSLMLDPLERKKEEPPPPPPPSSKQEPPPKDSPPPPPESPPTVALDVGAGITRGLLGDVAPVFGVTARWLQPSPWSFGLGAFHQPLFRKIASVGQTNAGNVGLAVTGVLTEGCFTGLGSHASMALDVCANLRMSLVWGSASGYPREGHELRPLVTLGPGLLWSQRFALGDGRFGVGLWARASADVPVVRASYDVEGAGIVYNGASTFFALSLGASFSLP
ncbi:hypothetical protein LZC95_07040 [Pendulispora brunnea]|uniref:Uncharacterized protein n=1 Tax=Pendulispora brunnea TaxID=2905690 RepID=A0ABZ2KJQ0_9BACT